ncbi:hypothetical protein HYFRA_00011734 [Hymenoscyphus fraxineus]|uniref:Lignostilbene dioxygenase n=1 Tax=Hymenoscyphus fraxineus TaxID=746836 RepID=A0A9N9L3G5_9HELO|nr:hypothetical protein HYFRA_00011734 [Hymenoscyphus fraxineus]
MAPTKLESKWPLALDLYNSNLPCRLEGDVADLVVLGTIPNEIDGTFYRMMCDPLLPPHPGNVPLDGDGNISALRFHNGRVDFKMRYVDTERLKIERKAGKAMFGLYRNPFTHHPCVRAAVDGTANTNIVFWADKFLALKEGGLPYQVDPHTLATITYDPFGDQGIKSKTFTAHPKIDPFTDELVVYGYEAKGLATTDIVVYALDKNGQKKDEQWVKAPWCGTIHDCAITPNWLILVQWPFDASIERMKKGGHHWAWNYDRAATFIVIPRRKTTKLPAGWKEGEYRVYTSKNEMLIHTAGAWESDDGSTLYLETTRVHDNAFPFFPTDDGRRPALDAKADLVRFTFDLSQPTDTTATKTETFLDCPAEFPRIDERFLSKKYDIVWLNVLTPPEHRDVKSDLEDDGTVLQRLDGVAQFHKSTGKIEYYFSGPDASVQEPVFIPRSDDAPEGDGWVMFMVERRTTNLCEVVIVDTREFHKPIAIIQLPFHMKAQVHGNWVDQRLFKERKSLVREDEDFKHSGRGALETWDI